jgi:hypothetical protein
MLPGAGETAVLRVELSRPLKATQMQRVVQQLLVVKAITRVDIAALEVEETESLPQTLTALSSPTQPSSEQLNLNNDQLLQDLNEPESQTAIATSRTRVSRQYRRLLCRRRARKEQ